MTLAALYQPPEAVQSAAHVSSMAQYQDMHARSLKDPEVRGGEGRRARGGAGAHAVPPRVTHAARPHALPPTLQGFWGEFAEQFYWNKKWETGSEFHK